VIPPDRLQAVPALVDELVAGAPEFRDRIRKTRESNIFNIGTSGKVAAALIGAKADGYLARRGGR
jgi:hypothetical protein